MNGRSRLFLGMVLALAALASARLAIAGVAGTSHDVTLGGQGVCSSCHVPHKALGARLWPVDMNQRNTHGVIGALCYYCHGPGDAGGSGIISSNLDNVWNPMTHGRTAGGNPDGGAACDGDLPYVTEAAAGDFECTTCHNVHDNGKRPFLWDDMDRLCLRCHPGRNFVGGAESAEVGSWGGSLGTANPGTHPVGNDVYADTGGDSPISPDFVGLGMLPWDDAGQPGTHNLGPHLIGGGVTRPGAGAGVGCNTCHAVHGTYPEGGDETPPGDDLLALPQMVAATGNEASLRHANGDGGTRNALCEACHQGPDPHGYGGGMRPNPGATNYTHPVDDYDAAKDMGVIGMPDGWPRGSNATSLAQPNLLCESCHLPHPRAAATAQADLGPPPPASGTHLLRSTYPELCLMCHALETFDDHHPYGPGLMSGGRFRDSDIGNGDADLTCEDCHEVGGAHNWPARSMPGLDPDWEPKDSSLGPDQPSDNGRIAEGEQGQNRFVTDKSKECFDCHTAGNSHFSPTSGKPGGRHGNPEYQYMEEGSHYLGAARPEFDFALGNYPDGVPWNAATGKWTGGGYSMFSGSPGAPEVVCESCHELQPGLNVSSTSLLLEPYRDGDTTDPSLLCEGCHGAAVGGGSSHPMTGDPVSKALDMQRGIGTLQTGGGAWDYNENPSGTFADQPGAPTGNSTYPAGDAMNCDSCHQVHDAAGYTMILDTDPQQLDIVTPVYYHDLYGVYDVPDSDAGTFNCAVLCRECHAR